MASAINKRLSFVYIGALALGQFAPPLAVAGGRRKRDQPAEHILYWQRITRTMFDSPCFIAPPPFARRALQRLRADKARFQADYPAANSHYAEIAGPSKGGRDEVQLWSNVPSSWLGTTHAEFEYQVVRETRDQRVVTCRGSQSEHTRSFTLRRVGKRASPLLRRLGQLMGVSLCAGHTGEVLDVKVISVEGLASHGSPESCASAGNRRCEALTGGDVGPVLSRERYEPLRGADSVRRRGRPHQTARYRERPMDPARSETRRMRPSTSYGNREILRPTREDGAVVRVGNPEGTRRR